MCCWQCVEVVCFSVNFIDFVVVVDIVVVIVMGVWDKFWCFGVVVGELEKGYFVGRGWIGDKVICWVVNFCCQIVFVVVVM